MSKALPRSDAEYEFIKSFSRGMTDESTGVFEFSADETVCEQLRALWTAYCLHEGLDTDTAVYDRKIRDLWEEFFAPLAEITQREPEADPKDNFYGFTNFDLYMGEHLC